MQILDTDSKFVREMVRQRSGIVLGPDKDYLVESRLTTLARQEGFPSWSELVRRARSHTFGGLVDKIVDAMTTNETSFFRDGHPFAAFQSELLPHYARIHGHPKHVKVWSAACSSGQEPYSVAMAMREAFGPIAFDQPPILATDLSESMLQRAKDGRYSRLEVGRGMPNPLLDKYFERDEASWRVRSSLSDLVDFQWQNLHGLWPDVGTFDVVFLRNVLIYFDTSTKQEILRRVHRVLRPNGVLLLGSSETAVGLHYGFSCSRIGSTICFFKGPKPNLEVYRDVSNG